MHTVSEFLKDLAKQLITDFERICHADHPVEKGTIGEFSSKKKLAECLPGLIKVNTGYVMDSFGSKSLQTDLIISEIICPSFSLGPEDEFRYFPCEGVCSVGEVKTNLGKNELVDSYKKINSVKSLKRNPLRNSFRKYGSSSPIIAECTNALDINNPYYQIFSFVLCKSLTIQPKTMIEHIINLDKKYSNTNVPNLFVSLDDGVFFRTKKTDNSFVITNNTKEHDSVVFTEFGLDNFPFLIHSLTLHIQEGTTTCESPIIPYLSKFNHFNSKLIATINQ